MNTIQVENLFKTLPFPTLIKQLSTPLPTASKTNLPVHNSVNNPSANPVLNSLSTPLPQPSFQFRPSSCTVSPIPSPKHRPPSRTTSPTSKTTLPHLHKKCRHLRELTPPKNGFYARICGGLRRPRPPRKRRAFNPKGCPCGHKIQPRLFYEAKPITFRKRCTDAFMWGPLLCGATRPFAPDNSGCCIPSDALARINLAEMILENGIEVFESRG